MFQTTIILSIATVIAYYWYRQQLLLDVNKKVYSHRPGPCRQVEGIEYGSEDIAMIEHLGIAFVTSGIYYMSPRSAEAKGRIYLYDFNKNDYKATELKINGLKKEDDFHPHGISHYVDGDSIRLYVVSHSTPGWKHSVYVLDYDLKKKELNVVRKITDEKFVRPNDLTVVGKDQFLVSNDGASQTPFWNHLEMITGYKGGSVVYYDGKNSHWLLESCVSANGISTDRSKTHVFVSHFNDKLIGIYELAKDFKSMKHLIDVDLKTAMDNHYVDEDGILWTGAHPVIHEAANTWKDMDNHDLYGPSQVLRIEFGPDYLSWNITEPYADDGRQASGSSIAVHYKNQLLVGTVCRQLVHCDVTLPETLRVE